jgi:alkylation response protein AidB-like acyl-CoA dehydrogenase
VPESLGGWQVDPVTSFRVFEDISAIDSAAGWLVSMSAAVSGLGLFLGDRAVEEMCQGGNNVFANAFSPRCHSVAAGGGYRLTGQFPFASNCKHADWFMALGSVNISRRQGSWGWTAPSAHRAVGVRLKWVVPEGGRDASNHRNHVRARTARITNGDGGSSRPHPRRRKGPHRGLEPAGG